MQTSVYEKIKLQIKKLNQRNNLYHCAVWMLIMILIFIFITTILQTNWFGLDLQIPILVWIISQPYVGVFFLPFFMLLTYISWFICSIGKPLTIKKIQSDIRTLFEDKKITKQEYDDLYNLLDIADIRNRKSYKEKLEIQELKINQKFEKGVDNEKNI